MATEQEFQYTLSRYLESEGQLELANIIKQSKVVYLPQWGFTGVVSDQRKLYIEIKTPIEFKTNLERKQEILTKFCGDIYEDNDEYAFWGVQIGILPVKLTTTNTVDNSKLVVEDSIYQSFINELISLDIDEIEKAYLYEACDCAARDNKLAAATMLGCAAEYLLINLCDAYWKYLKKNGTTTESDAFERKVIKAKSAYERLDEFEKRVEAKSDLFKNFGFENPKLNFNFLDIVRQTRNQAGHPTGKVISKNDLKTHFGNYQHFIKLAHELIKGLPTFEEI